MTEPNQDMERPSLAASLGTRATQSTTLEEAPVYNHHKGQGEEDGETSILRYLIVTESHDEVRRHQPLDPAMAA